MDCMKDILALFKLCKSKRAKQLGLKKDASVKSMCMPAPEYCRRGRKM